MCRTQVKARRPAQSGSDNTLGVGRSHRLGLARTAAQGRCGRSRRGRPWTRRLHRSDRSPDGHRPVIGAGSDQQEARRVRRRSMPSAMRTSGHRVTRRIRQSLNGYDWQSRQWAQGGDRRQAWRLLAQVTLAAMGGAQGRIAAERGTVARRGCFDRDGIAVIGMLGVGGHGRHRRKCARRMARQGQLGPHQCQHRQQRNRCTPAVAAEAVHCRSHSNAVRRVGS
ncbi:hypothetical protein DFR29_12176 [Tahibacter aquaticus]|uniref:Uncharacterized protein n=1 Tax=Tahibacter aquaticus TaxID=520092 RepID=A0A4R6YMF9_9GAMM|nr:hypothetical protein DFR29_12176 [Tahibacter aquaticus]